MKISELPKWLPAISGLLVFFGTLQVSIFYSQFGIPVLTYLTISEILILFLNDLNTIIPVVIIALLHGLLSAESKAILPADLLEMVLLRFRSSYRIFFCLGTIVFGYLLFSARTEFALWNVYLFVFFSVQFLFFLFVRKKVNTGTGQVELEVIAGNFVLFCSIFLVSSIIPLNALRQAEHAKSQYISVQLTFHDGTSYTNANNTIFLGKAGNQYFFADHNGFTVIKDEKVTAINSLVH